MKRVGILLVVCTLAAACLAVHPLVAKEGARKDSVLAKRLTNDDTKFICVGKLFNGYQNNGNGGSNNYTWKGLEYPKGNSDWEKIVVYEDGIVWGGIQSGMMKVGGSTYRSGLQAGRVITPGVPGGGAHCADPSDPHNRLYAVRRDISPSTPASLAERSLAEESALSRRYELSWTPSYLRERYVQDWNEWPATEGAPFDDVNHDGIYDPSIDIPGIPGADQTLWHVSNDFDEGRTRYLYGSDPLGIEFQRTIWTYRRNDVLGATIFYRAVLINKSTIPVDSFFIGLWSDVDIGSYTDDVNGCDTTLAMAYGYNGRTSDYVYGTNVPAVGYTLLQGPIVAGSSADTATFFFAPRTGFRNLSLWAANTVDRWYFGGSPPLGTYTGSIMTYNWLRGLTVNGLPFVNPVTNAVTRFLFPGDPVGGSGWTYATPGSPPPGDRTVVESAGPIRFAPGDTQEVVIAVTVAEGGDNLSSVALLKQYVHGLWIVQQDHFQIAARPPSPHVTASELDGQVVLSWDEPNVREDLENFDSRGYRFQGYLVDQLSDSSFVDPVSVAVYDLVDAIAAVREYDFDPAIHDVVDHIVIRGTNTGLQRYYRTGSDARDGSTLVNGRRYFYAVRSYSVNSSPNAIPRHLESDPVIVTVTPQQSKPGDGLRSAVGAFLDTTRFERLGSNDAQLAVEVVDPGKITGHRYQVVFTGDSVRWNLRDSSLGETRATSQPAIQQYYRFNPDPSLPVAGGLQFRVTLRTLNAIRSVDYFDPEYQVTRTEFLHRTTYGTVDRWGIDAPNADNYEAALAGITGSPENAHEYEIRFVSGATGSQYYFRGPGVHMGDSLASDRLPFEVWDATANQQLIPVIVDMDGDRRFSTRKEGLGPRFGTSLWWGRFWEPLSVLRPAASGFSAEPLPDPAMFSDTITVIHDLQFFNFSDTSVAAAFPVPAGGVLHIRAADWPEANEGWIVNTLGLEPVSGDRELALQTMEHITVYPNPYFAVNADEPNNFTHFVTFSHLPRRAVLRIYSLGGVLVRTLVKDDDSQYLRWDLTNEERVWVCSGMYLVRVELPDFGTTKMLKLALIQRTYIPEHY